jgi:hypothetical protein
MGTMHPRDVGAICTYIQAMVSMQSLYVGAIRTYIQTMGSVRSPDVGAMRTYTIGTMGTMETAFAYTQTMGTMHPLNVGFTCTCIQCIHLMCVPHVLVT